MLHSRKRSLVSVGFDCMEAKRAIASRCPLGAIALGANEASACLKDCQVI
ncbi:hypothetical protein H6H02_08115 [Coleofasciculus sp. FACHB-1120]|nr:hypothetical protein [Coleofasciculus sp. FACHB-1120]